MDVPKTQSGSPCKNCSSGKKCPHHKSPSSKKSGSPEHLHIDYGVMWNMLMHMDRKTLNSMCKVNKLANKLCKDPNFKKAYALKHPPYRGRNGIIIYDFDIVKINFEGIIYAIKGIDAKGTPISETIHQAKAKELSKRYGKKIINLGNASIGE